MSLETAETIWLAAGLYAALGATLALLLLLGGLRRVDPLAAASPLSVRLLIVPGLVALWPLMLVKFLRGVRT